MSVNAKNTVWTSKVDLSLMSSFLGCFQNSQLSSFNPIRGFITSFPFISQRKLPDQLILI
ncbi:hypothetical protein ACTXT7_014384 [Hymenolepis weldensis]